MNKKGFTLVELLAVIVILGIITGISIPIVRNIQMKNEQKEYTTYLESMKHSAKLYVNSYAEDMFGYNKSGCAIIRYSQLEEKGLLKDIPIDKISCADDSNTYVKVVKIDDQITYVAAIGCGEKKGDGTIALETQIPEGGISGVDACGVEVNAIMGFSANPESAPENNAKKRNITITMTSHTGFYEGASIMYGFVKDTDKAQMEATPSDTYLLNGWKKLDINYVGGSEQKQIISGGNPVSLSAKPVTTPENTTGELYLVLRIDSLKDIGGNNWTNYSSDYLFFGSYKVDNIKPVFADTSKVISSTNGYNDVKPKLNISVTDNYSSRNDMSMCISYDNDTCSKVVKDIKNKVNLSGTYQSNVYVTYNGDLELNSIQEELDGSTHTIYVTVGDAAGNYETKNYSYQLSEGRGIGFIYTGSFIYKDGSGAEVTGTPNAQTILNEKDWYIKFLSSGTLKILSNTGHIDVFAVGGGGGGSTARSSSVGGSGGGGGFIEEVRDVAIVPGKNYSLTIGAGGAGGNNYNRNEAHPGSDGNPSTVTFESVTVTGAGGIHGETSTGGAGTGRGGDTYQAGEDGKCPFEDCSFINYKYGAGGGGGAKIDCSVIGGGYCSRPRDGGKGGESGGGSWRNGRAGNPGDVNSGGGGAAGSPGEEQNDGARIKKGGAGGSGIIIIRNKR